MTTKPKKALTFEERKGIEKGIEQGKTNTEIAKSLSRSTNAISTEIRNNGGKLNYSAEKGQKSSSERKKQKNELLANMARSQRKPHYLIARVENLEMQVEILHEAIKELMNR